MSNNEGGNIWEVGIRGIDVTGFNWNFSFQMGPGYEDNIENACRTEKLGYPYLALFAFD